ncbi:MAG: hypothetical protein QXG08_04570 [Candidatus Methanomethyliaceae archaeon]
MTWRQYVKEVLKRYEATIFTDGDGKLVVAVNRPLLSAEEELEAALEIEWAMEMLLEAYEEFERCALKNKN